MPNRSMSTILLCPYVGIRRLVLGSVLARDGMSMYRKEATREKVQNTRRYTGIAYLSSSVKKQYTI